MGVGGVEYAGGEAGKADIGVGGVEKDNEAGGKVCMLKDADEGEGEL